MRVFIFTALCLIVPFSVKAQDIRVSSFCQQVITHQAGSDVAYQPGVDVDGNAVVPADLNRIEMPIVDPVQVPVQIDLTEYLDLGGATDIEGLELKPNLADIEVFQDGRILYNGQDISQNILTACNARDDVQKELPKPDPQAIEVEVLDTPPQSSPAENENGVLGGQYP